MDIELVKDGIDRYRLVVNGQTLGWIHKWYKREALNETGVKLYRAKPIGLAEDRYDCPTLESAKAYILGYFEGEGNS